MSADAIERSIDSYFTGSSTMNVYTILTAFAERAIFIVDPVGSPMRTGYTEIRTFLEELFSLLDSVSLNADSIFGSGNERAVKWSMSGQGKNGHAINTEGINVMTFNDAGAIQTLTIYWDAPALLAELQS